MSKKPFVEMDLEYLLGCDSRMLFTDSVFEEIPKEFVVSDQSLAGGMNRVRYLINS